MGKQIGNAYECRPDHGVGALQAGSAELIAVSSLITYDVYRTYLNREASGAEPLQLLTA